MERQVLSKSNLEREILLHFVQNVEVSKTPGQVPKGLDPPPRLDRTGQDPLGLVPRGRAAGSASIFHISH